MPTPKSLTTCGIQIKLPQASVIDVADDPTVMSETTAAVVSKPAETDIETLPSHHSADPLFEDEGSRTTAHTHPKSQQYQPLVAERVNRLKRPISADNPFSVAALTGRVRANNQHRPARPAAR